MAGGSGTPVLYVFRDAAAREAWWKRPEAGVVDLVGVTSGPGESESSPACDLAAGAPVIVRPEITPQFRMVAHVGDLSASRTTKGGSLEGGALSVSQCPAAWTSIARLGGSETWVLRKDDPMFYEVPRPIPGEVLSWCVGAGFLEPTRRFRATWYDSEDDCTLSADFDTREEALAEMDFRGEAEPPMEVEGWRFGPKGLAYREDAFGAGQVVSHDLAEAYAPLFWAEAMGYDGYWWHEELNVMSYSAPRGAIFQSKLSEWGVAVES